MRWPEDTSNLVSGRVLQTAVLVVLLATHPSVTLSQRHYVNTHASGPVRVEDALPEGRGVIEFRIPAIRLDDPDAGPRKWRLDPMISFGLSDRTSLELGASLVWLGSVKRPGGGLTGVDFGVSHLFANETHGRPALAATLDAFFPAGSLGSGGVWSQLRVMATRTRGLLRAHVNGAVGTYRVELTDPGATCKASSILIKLGISCDGSSLPVLPGGPCALGSVAEAARAARIWNHCARVDPAFAIDTTIVTRVVTRARHGMRWFGGFALDRDVPRWSTLFLADVYASRLDGLQTVNDWGADVGVRRQVGGYVVLEMAIGRRFKGSVPGWSAVGGLAVTGR